MSSMNVFWQIESDDVKKRDQVKNLLNSKAKKLRYKDYLDGFFFQNQPWDILLMLLLPSDCHSMLPFSSRCFLTIPQFSVITHFQRCNNFFETKNFHDLKINALLEM